MRVVGSTVARLGFRGGVSFDPVEGLADCGSERQTGPDDARPRCWDKTYEQLSRTLMGRCGCCSSSENTMEC